MNNLPKRIELFANISIIAITVLLAVLIFQHLFLPKSGTTPAPSEIKPGTKIVLSNVDWSRNNRTLLLVLSEDCHFCTESAEFYRRLGQQAARRGNTRIIAVLPQEVNKGQAYLNALGVIVNEVRQIPLNVLHVKGTPTLILVDSGGIITESWIGKLSADKEADVLNRL